MMPEPEYRTIDLRGQVCPGTLLAALREINNGIAGIREGLQVMVVLTDNRDSCVTIPGAATNMGLKVTVRDEGSYYRMELRDGGFGI
ncbi:MAG TPA: sulfurtransferase TusA family protein [Desulfuromonadales bacterium]|nr:sulfurtransferase TusA family protein [Desulfuromonadales bacterium]